jgi:hypothetical protein
LCVTHLRLPDGSHYGWDVSPGALTPYVGFGWLRCWFTGRCVWFRGWVCYRLVPRVWVPYAVCLTVPGLRSCLPPHGLRGVAFVHCPLRVWRFKFYVCVSGLFPLVCQFRQVRAPHPPLLPRYPFTLLFWLVGSWLGLVRAWLGFALVSRGRTGYYHARRATFAAICYLLRLVSRLVLVWFAVACRAFIWRGG